VWVGPKKRDAESNKETGMKKEECREIALDFEGLIQGAAWKWQAEGDPERRPTLNRPWIRVAVDGYLLGEDPLWYPRRDVAGICSGSKSPLCSCLLIAVAAILDAPSRE